MTDSGNPFETLVTAPPNIPFTQQLADLKLDPEKQLKISERLDHFLSLIATLNPDDQEKIEAATLAMLDLHKDQNDRPDGMPYNSHPLEVARTVIEDFDVRDIDLITVALFHDAIEDQASKLVMANIENHDDIQAAAFDEIRTRYGDRVVSILQKLTNPDFDEIATRQVSPQNVEEFVAKKNELYKDHVELAIQDDDALVIKLADFTHNTSDASQLLDPAKKEKYRRKYVPVIEVFINRLEREDIPCPISNKEAAISKLKAIEAKFGS